MFHTIPNSIIITDETVAKLYLDTIKKQFPHIAGVSIIAIRRKSKRRYVILQKFGSQ